MPQQHTQAFLFFFCFYKNNLSNLHAEMIFRLKNIARKKHPPLTLSVGSAATHKKQLPSVKLEHSKRLVPRYLQLYLCSSLSLFPISLSLSVPGNPCVWADVQSHHEHCGPSPLSSSAPYCPCFPFVLLISFFFFLPSDITKWTAELKGSIASLQKKTSIWQQRVMLL